MAQLPEKAKKYVVSVLNDFNNFGLNEMGKSEIILFLLLAWYVKEGGSEKNSYDIKYSELINTGLFGKISVKQMKEISYRLSKKIFKIGGIFENMDGDVIMAHVYEILFPNMKENFEYFNVTVHPKLKGMIVGITKEFTVLDITILSKLNSPYAVKLCRKIMQYCNTGVYKVSIEDFCSMMGLPENTRRNNIIPRYVEPAIKEISVIYPDITYKKSTVNKSITGFTFSFTPEKRRKYTEEEVNAIERKKQAQEDTVKDDSSLRENNTEIGTDTDAEKWMLLEPATTSFYNPDDEDCPFY